MAAYDQVDLEGETFFTEDHIPIETLHVGNIPPKVTKEKLKTYFETYGEVVSVSINQAGTRYSPYFYGFVTFENAAGAAKALSTTQHSIHFRRIKVKPADSWNQPKRNKVRYSAKKIDEPETDNSPTDEMSILHLNDDCLFQIASMLSLSDLLTLSKVCQRLEYIAGVMFSKCKVLDMMVLENCTLMKIREILSRVGPHVQKIRCSGIFGTIEKKRFVDFLPKFCTKVRTLEFICMKGIHYAVYRKMFRAFKNLTVLNLQDCCVNDDVCAVLFNCENLENLNMSENYEITGRNLDKLLKLKFLNLKYCLNLQPSHFNALCETTKLVTLNIERCDRLNKSSMELLLKHQTSLENISISNSYQTRDLCPIAQLKSLKSLEIRCHNELDDKFFEDLAKHRGTALERLEITRTILNLRRKQALWNLENLKELCIPRTEEIDDTFISRMAISAPLTYFCCAGCRTVSNESILTLIRKSRTIEKIDISSCSLFYDDWILQVVEVLKAINRTKPLTLIVGNTGIDESITNDPRVSGNSHLLDLRFEFTNLFFDFEEDDEYTMYEGSGDSDDFDSYDSEFLDDDDLDSELDFFLFPFHFF